MDGDDTMQVVTCVPDALPVADSIDVHAIVGGQTSNVVYVSVVDKSISQQMVTLVWILAAIAETIILVRVMLLSMLYFGGC